MTSISMHEDLRLKITAYMFNRRADALRGEMYRVLCLEIFNDTTETISYDEIAKRVAAQLGDKVKVTDSLKAIVYDELRGLIKDGFIVIKNGGYKLEPNVKPIELQQENPQIELGKSLYKPIEAIALSLSNNVSPSTIKKLLDFFINASQTIANNQASTLSKGVAGNPTNGEDKDEISSSISHLWEEYGLKDEIDFNAFVSKALIHPDGVLADYLYKLIQVNIIIQLLSWDPNLEFLKNSILANKTLYLDTSALFVLMQKSHPLHHFFLSMLLTTKNDLGVKFKVHEMTINEYKNAIEWAEKENTHSYKDIRVVAQVCKNEGKSPFDFVDNNIIADYISGNYDHIDAGTWHRYKTSVVGRAFFEMLKYLSVETEKEKISVPYTELSQIKELLVKASLKQVSKRKRGNVKSDTDHDARIYYRIKSSRKRITDASIGFDKYLLTLDGSLVHFSQLLGLPITDTYFVFPNQWYELTFPFLRLDAKSLTQITSGLVSMFYSRAFPKLTALIPLELCKYIFENGGQELSYGSIRNIAEAMTEERLVDSLRQDNNDIQKNEQAKLRVARLIAEEEIRKNKELQEAKKRTEELKKIQENLTVDVDILASSKEKLTSELGDIDQLRERVNTLEKTRSDESRAFQKQLDDILFEQKRANAKAAEEAKAKRVNLSTALMIIGLLGGLAWLSASSVLWYWNIVFVAIMVLGIIYYIRTVKTYILALTLVIGLIFVLILTQSQTNEPWISIIGFGWSVLTFFVDFFLKDKKEEIIDRGKNQ